MTLRGRGPHPDELISASLSGDLSGDEQQRLDAHLASCAECRDTLAAFRQQRASLHGLRAIDPPRDLAARVSAGIESGRFERAAWWRRPRVLLGIGGSLATVAAGILAVVVLGNLRPTSNPVAVTTATASVAESMAPPPASASATPTLSEMPSPTPAIELAAGQLAAIIATGGTPTQPVRNWELRDLSNQRSIQVEAASGVPVSAALSPTGDQLAYITSLGESGAQEVRILNLTDGSTLHIGCSAAWPFTERLIWSPDGSQLAYTRAGVDLGGSQSDCADAPVQPAGEVDVWIYNATTQKATRRTVSGDAYAADYRPAAAGDEAPRLLVSHAAPVPWTEELVPIGSQGADTQPVENVFMPRLSPDGTRAMFWRGTMDGGPSGWGFVAGGMPYLSATSRADWTVSPDGTQLFTDLAQVGGQAFASGNLIWAPDGRHVAFWNGAWSGTEQGPQGDYPDHAAAYVGSSTQGLTIDSRVNPGETGTFVEDVKFDAQGQAVLVMVASPSAGIGAAPAATIYRVPLAGGQPTEVGTSDGDPLPWIGPVVVGTETPSPSPGASGAP